MQKLLIVDFDGRLKAEWLERLGTFLKGVERIRLDSGEDRLRTVGDIHPDALLLCGGVETGSLLECVEAIESDRELQAIPVICLCGEEGNGAMFLRVLDAGADLCLREGTEAEEAAAQIRVMLRFRQYSRRMESQQWALREKIRLERQKLQSERQILRTIIDHIPDAVYTKDAEFRKTMANPADLANVGVLTEAELLGKTDYDFFPKEMAEAFHADDRVVIEEGIAVTTVRSR